MLDIIGTYLVSAIWDATFGRIRRRRMRKMLLLGEEVSIPGAVAAGDHELLPNESWLVIAPGTGLCVAGDRRGQLGRRTVFEAGAEVRAKTNARGAYFNRRPHGWIIWELGGGESIMRVGFDPVYRAILEDALSVTRLNP